MPASWTPSMPLSPSPPAPESRSQTWPAGLSLPQACPYESGFPGVKHPAAHPLAPGMFTRVWAPKGETLCSPLTLARQPVHADPAPVYNLPLHCLSVRWQCKCLSMGDVPVSGGSHLPATILSRRWCTLEDPLLFPEFAKTTRLQWPAVLCPVPIVRAPDQLQPRKCICHCVSTPGSALMNGDE